VRLVGTRAAYVAASVTSAPTRAANSVATPTARKSAMPEPVVRATAVPKTIGPTLAHATIKRYARDGAI